MNIAGNDNITTFEDMIHKLAKKYAGFWWAAKTDFPELKKSFGKNEKRIKEKSSDQFIKRMSGEMGTIPYNKDILALWRKNVKQMVMEFGKSTIELADGYINILFDDGFINSTAEFVKAAKNFEPKIRLEDIFQAIRNVWIMNSIQILHNH